MAYVWTYHIKHDICDMINESVTSKDGLGQVSLIYSGRKEFLR